MRYDRRHSEGRKGSRMSFFDNISIKLKIQGIIVPIAVAGLAGAGLVSWQFYQSSETYNLFVTEDTVSSSETARSITSMVSAPYIGYQYMHASADEGAKKDMRASYEQSKMTLIKRLENASKLTPEDVAAIKVFLTQANEIFTLVESAFASVDQGRVVQANRALQEADKKVVKWREDVRSFNDKRVQSLNDENVRMNAAATQTIYGTLIGLTVLFGFAIVAAAWFSGKGISGPIDRLRQRMILLADGETQAPIQGLDRKDEIGAMAKAVSVFRDNAIERIKLEAEANENRSLSEQDRLTREAQKAKEAADIKFAVDHLATALTRLSEGDVSYRIEQQFIDGLDGIRQSYNSSAARLENALLRVAENARAIDGGANEIRSSADDLAKRTEQQAASVEETAAALEQITTAVKDSTRRAQEAGALVAHTKLEAERSGEVVQRAVIAMQQIEKSSSEISNIISVIDEIAFQTNLLALNAGVEAARAGEAGKGFAVVAQEVRELAQRSASAAKDIKSLITTSNQHVQSGVALVGQTGEALTKISSEVVEINGHVSAIVEAAQEQSSGLQEINTAVNHMDQDTQKNAAMVEEANAASHSLASESASLAQLLAQFRLSSGTSNAKSAPQAVTASARPAQQPVASPARSLGRKVAAAFSGRGAAAENWEEF